MSKLTNTVDLERRNNIKNFLLLSAIGVGTVVAGKTGLITKAIAGITGDHYDEKLKDLRKKRASKGLVQKTAMEKNLRLKQILRI